MESRKRNRFQLLLARKKLSLVKQGIKILTDKRDALMKEFHGMVRPVYEARNELTEKTNDAGKALMLAHGLEPHMSLLSSAIAARQQVLFPVTVKQVWGVKIPSIDYQYEKRGLFERGSLPGYRNPAVDETAERFESVIAALIKSAVLESRLNNVGRGVKSASRRVNALEQRVEPELRRNIKSIRNYLEEMSREEVFRMKRYKAIQEKKRGSGSPREFSSPNL